MDSFQHFMHDLHYAIDNVKPPDWVVDWNDAPLAYKLYRGNLSIQLSSDVPLTLREVQYGKPSLRTVGHILWFTYGITQYSEYGATNEGPYEMSHSIYSIRRIPPSGGSLYPSEVYVYLKLSELPEGVYHYDAAHHRLHLLRQGNFDCYLDRAMGSLEAMNTCIGAVFVSTMYWKNFFKYNYFSYRLQALDAGVVIGQLLESVKWFGLSSRVHYQYLDRAINHLLGLNERDESVYAIISLATVPVIPSMRKEQVPVVTDQELVGELPVLSSDVYRRTKRTKPFPLLIQMNNAARQESTSTFRRLETDVIEQSGSLRAHVLPLTGRLNYDFAEACRNRYSPEQEYSLRTVEEWKIATLLLESTSSFQYRNDLDHELRNGLPRISLVGCFYGCQSIPDGAYRYDYSSHALRQIRAGDQRPFLQRAMSYPNINLNQVPICLHVEGGKDHLYKELGYRGYRIQQMEVGMLVQRILLTASATGWGTRPLLGFDTRACEQIYGLDTNSPSTLLIQLPIGPCRPRARIAGHLHA